MLRLINAYRVRGHQNARLDPLNLRPQLPLPDLQPSYYGLDKDDMEQFRNDTWPRWLKEAVPSLV